MVGKNTSWPFDSRLVKSIDPQERMFVFFYSKFVLEQIVRSHSYTCGHFFATLLWFAVSSRLSGMNDVGRESRWTLIRD